MLQPSLLALLYLLPALSLAQSFDFKGIALGARPPTAEIERQLGIKCSKSDGDQACYGTSTMMSLPATVSVDILAGSVARMDVFFNRILFDEAAKSLKEKYGRPFRQQSAMIVWRNKRGDLVILERSGLLSYSSIEHQQANAEAVKKLKKDF
jgi:hypothetical protein